MRLNCHAVAGAVGPCDAIRYSREEETDVLAKTASAASYRASGTDRLHYGLAELGQGNDRSGFFTGRRPS
jgi:hypothetical protein